MTWTRLPDDFYESPTWLAVSRDARLLAVEALTFCNRHLTDGRLPLAALTRVTDSPEPDAAVAELVAVGLWSMIDDRTAQLDWSEQEPAADVKRRQAQRAEKQRRYRDRVARHGAGDHSVCDPRYCPQRRVTSHETGNATGNQTGDEVGLVTPSRPVPSLTGTGTGTEGGGLADARPAAPDGHIVVKFDERPGLVRAAWQCRPIQHNPERCGCCLAESEAGHITIRDAAENGAYWGEFRQSFEAGTARVKEAAR